MAFLTSLHIEVCDKVVFYKCLFSKSVQEMQQRSDSVVVTEEV